MHVTQLLLIALLPVAIQGPPAPDALQRLAAVRYALAHGFDIPSSGLIVAAEMGFQRGQVRRTTVPIAEQLREAAEIAKLIGPSVGTGWAEDHLLCPEGRCYAATRTTVLVVEAAFPSTPGRPHSGGPGIYIKLYSPALNPGERAMLQQAVVDTERRGTGWVGTGFSAEPTRFAVK